MTKRKGGYFKKPSGKRRGAEYENVVERPNLATINMDAGKGRAGFAVGDRVRIGASGLYSGEMAVIEKLSSGVIPSALVRAESGGTRQVRTIDLEPVQAEKRTQG
ncbi:MAG TPA: hypothetical protein VM305_01505 [Candidatus Limnocylindrales bacterium]|nr:hypothetical protein [Candidatus Limnocylindrales bacterium]